MIATRKPLIVVGRTNGNGTITPHAPVRVSRAILGDIVYVGGENQEWYRVYDDGTMLRYWNVTAKFADALHVASNPHLGMPVYDANDYVGAGGPR